MEQSWKLLYKDLLWNLEYKDLKGQKGGSSNSSYDMVYWIKVNKYNLISDFHWSTKPSPQTYQMHEFLLHILFLSGGQCTNLSLCSPPCLQLVISVTLPMWADNSTLILRLNPCIGSTKPINPKDMLCSLLGGFSLPGGGHTNLNHTAHFLYNWFWV